MKEILAVTFSTDRLPEGWVESKRFCTFEENGLRSGKAARFHIPLPENITGPLRVEVDIESADGAAVQCGDGVVAAMLDLKRGDCRFTAGALAELAANRRPKQTGVRRQTLAFEFGGSRLKAFVDGVEAVAADDPYPPSPFSVLELQLWDDVLLRALRVLGAPPEKEPASSLPRSTGGPGFHLEVCVDFADDLRLAPWTPAMFGKLFAEFKSWGVKRCHWIHYGSRKEGWWRGAHGAIASNAEETMRLVGGEIFGAAVRAAHHHQIEIHALLKPFDMGLHPTLGEAESAVQPGPTLRRVGGSASWIADFALAHREWIMARKPSNQGAGEPGLFTRLDLVKEDALPADFSVDDVRIYVSDDNVSYRPYEGPVEREETIEDYPLWEHTASGGRPTGASRRARVLRLKGMKIPNRYLVLKVDSASGSFANRLVNLVHLFGEKGEERKITYGVTARRARRGTVSGAIQKSAPADFRTTGIEFDYHPGTPTAVFPGFDAIRARRAFDAGERLLAIARGKDDGPVAALSPSFPEVREWWLSWLKEALEAGADGIEIRVRNHHSPLAWGEFGFEKPVRDEFLRRHGVDLWETDDFDRAAWRRLRGEGYTRFLSQARDLAASYGKPMGIHISPTLHMEPEEGAAMEIHWDWRTWIRDGLADTVTMKEVWPGTRFAQEVMALTRAAGVATIFCPYANPLWSRPEGEAIVGAWISMAKERGCDGYQYYECASVIKGTPDGEILLEQPPLKEVFRAEFDRDSKHCTHAESVGTTPKQETRPCLPPSSFAS